MKPTKRFRFPKGVRRVNIPLLQGYALWSDEIEKEIEKAQERFGTSKSARWGYIIEDGFAQITVTRIRK